MGTVVRYSEQALRVGDAVLEVNHAVFDDPRVLRVLVVSNLGSSIRALRFLLTDSGYSQARAILLGAQGNQADHARAMIQTIIEGECPHLMTLMWMAHSHPDELEADFQRFYSINLTVALESDSPRRLSKLAHSLPVEGAVHRAANPDWQWGLTEQLLAGVYDSLSFLRWESARLAGAKPGKAPEQMPRPGVTPSKDMKTFGKGEGFESIEDFDTWYAAEQARMKPVTA